MSAVVKEKTKKGKKEKKPSKEAARGWKRNKSLAVFSIKEAFKESCIEG
jgi:hypothetical protein